MKFIKKHTDAIQSLVLIATLCILMFQVYDENKSKKVDNLIKLNQQIYPSPKTNQIMEKLYSDPPKPILQVNGGPFSFVELDNFLGYFEMIGIIYDKKYIDKDIIIDMFSTDIETFFRNQEIVDYFSKSKNTGCNWPYLHFLYEEIIKKDKKHITTQSS